MLPYPVSSNLPLLNEGNTRSSYSRATSIILSIQLIIVGLLFITQMSGENALIAGSILTAAGIFIIGINSIMFCIKMRKINLQKLTSSVYAKDDQLIVCGSSTLSHAKVFCFAEYHEKSHFRKKIAEIIQEHHRPGDLILVEGLKAGTIISAKSHQITSFLPEGYQVEGWEPDNFRELNHNFFKKNDEMLARVKAMKEQIEEKLPPKKFDKKDLSSLEKFLPIFIEEYIILANYFCVSINNVQFENGIYNTFKSFEARRLSVEGNDARVFYYIILELLKRLEENQEFALHKWATPEQIKEVIENARIRNISMCLSLKKAHSLGKKAFVIAGMGHFLLLPSSKPEIVSGIKKYLIKHPHVILIQKDWYQKLEIAKFNPEFTEMYHKGEELIANK